MAAVDGRQTPLSGGYGGREARVLHLYAFETGLGMHAGLLRGSTIITHGRPTAHWLDARQTRHTSK
jgi:hypothetical protein